MTNADHSTIYVRLGAWCESDQRFATRSKMRQSVVFVDHKFRRIARDGVVVALPMKQFQVSAAILSHLGGYISHAEMSLHLYGDDPDGGPENIHGTHRATIHKIRGPLRSLGFVIICDRRRYTRIESATSHQQVAA